MGEVGPSKASCDIDPELEEEWSPGYSDSILTVISMYVCARWGLGGESAKRQPRLRYTPSVALSSGCKFEWESLKHVG
jgi:hypothetical protein